MRNKCPVVPYSYQTYLHAFYSLNNDRLNIGGHLGGISFIAKKAYLELHPSFHVGSFLAIIDHIDAEYLEAVNRVQSKQKDTQ